MKVGKPAQHTTHHMFQGLDLQNVISLSELSDIILTQEIHLSHLSQISCFLYKY